MTAETATETVATRPGRIGYHVSSWLRQRILERDAFTCLYCGLQASSATAYLLQVDHIVPLVKGGTARSDNLATACRGCNQRKGDMGAEEFCAGVIGRPVPSPARLQNRLQRSLAYLERIEREYTERIRAAETAESER